MNILLAQLDGSIPNLALMRIAAHHRRIGDTVELRRMPTVNSVERNLFDPRWDRVYASTIFERTRHVAERLRRVYPDSVIGGTGWDFSVTLASVGIPDDTPPDYSDYANWPHSLGFTQRGCRLKCSFCVVPKKEGKVQEAATIHDVWRGEPWPKNIVLLDNDFFGQPHWRERIEEIRTGGFKVCWTQGFNVRLIGDEEAAAVSSVRYSDGDFERPRLYTAWDNRKDEARLFRNLESLVRHGVKPDHIMVYMLIGYWDGPQLTEDDFYRHARLREFGCRPYPMPFVRTRELTGFQRWIVRRDDLIVPWEEFKRANYRPEKIGPAAPQRLTPGRRET